LALDNTTTLVVNTAHYFRAPVGTAKPTDYKAISAPWEEIGHTDAEEIMSFASEGGDTTVLATLQNKQLRTTKAPLTESFGLTLQQFNEEALKLYYGANATKAADGAIRPASNPTPTQVAFLAVFWDGENVFPIYAEKVEISRGGEVDLADPENLAGLPLTIQPLNNGANDWPYEVGPLVPTVEPIV
jgi:hypothetical protein